MKRLALLLFLVSVVHAASDVLLFAWQESREEKSGEKRFGFFLAPAAVKRVVEADAKGDKKAVDTLSAKLPKDAWMYGLLLTGESQVYPKEKIALFEPSPCGSELELVSGSIEVDRKTGTVRVTLKVKQDDRLIDFVANGVYRINK
jgi:hypothetical protein